MRRLVAPLVTGPVARVALLVALFGASAAGAARAAAEARLAAGDAALGLTVAAVVGLALIAVVAGRLALAAIRRRAGNPRHSEPVVPAQRFQAVLDSVQAGACIIDAERRIVACNRRYADIYALPAELVRPGALIDDILEHRLRQGMHTQADIEDYRQTGIAAVVTTSMHTRHLRDGRVITINRRPLGDGCWISLHEDITEEHNLRARLEAQNELLRQREHELEAQNENLDRALAQSAEQKEDLDAALSHMSQGLAMFDADERLVLANDRYAEIYGLEPRHLRPGTTLAELIDYRIARGLYPGMTAAEVLGNMRERLKLGTANQLISKPSDGSTISVSIHPRKDGGWVTTLHDLTEREELNSRLREQYTLLQQREEELEAQNARFDLAISNMSQGMCLFDAQHRVVFGNARYAELYRLDPGLMRAGTRIEEIFAAHAEQEGWQGEEAEAKSGAGLARFARSASEVKKLADGRFISIVRRAMPGGGVLTTHDDITEREALLAELAQRNELLEQREHELAARNEQLDVAMNNMSQGLAMFDAEHRLIVCNRRYREMYHHKPDEVQPGTSLRQIFEYRLANGQYHVSDRRGFIDSWAAQFGEVSSRVQELSDGRIINVLRRRTPSGGRVITHEDITERQRLSTRLTEQNGRLLEQEEQLKQQNLQLDAALNNMLQGLAMFDAELRLVMCNKRYAEMYAFEPGQLRPGTPLKSIIEHRIALGEFAGRSPEELIAGMMERVAERQVAHYVSNLTDGRCISVSVLPMPDGGTVTTHHDITEQRRSEAKIAHMALHDTLTGLPNRVLLNERLEDALRRVKRGEIVAMHLIDLDHFKTVNDTLGHPAGDRLLESVAVRLRSAVRETDTIARMGGDEFAIVQTAIAQPADATALAHRVIEAVSAPYTIEGNQVVIGTSVGIAVGPSDGESHDQLIRNADLALYRAKADGRGTYRFFEPEMDAQMQARRLVENDLRRAVEVGEFELHYQPFVNLERSEVSGFEALVRWRHPTKGLIAPGTFIPLAEEMGLIVPLGEWAIREACAMAARLPQGLRVAVNLSPTQFRNPGLVQVVTDALAASGLAPERLELEITESTLLLDSEETVDMLYQFRAQGVRIALDDFGTGYSSLSLLQSFPFDKLKIDRSFVRDIAAGVGSLNIVRAVTVLASSLGMTTTAEGVETQEQLEAVKAEGCTEMQGFVYSRPMPASAVEGFLQQRREERAQREAARPSGSAASAA